MAYSSITANYYIFLNYLCRIFLVIYNVIDFPCMVNNILSCGKIKEFAASIASLRESSAGANKGYCLLHTNSTLGQLIGVCVSRSVRLCVFFRNDQHILLFQGCGSGG